MSQLTSRALIFSITKKINRMVTSDWFYYRHKYLNPIILKLVQLKNRISDEHFLDQSFEKQEKLVFLKLYLIRRTKVITTQLKKIEKFPESTLQTSNNHKQVILCSENNIKKNTLTSLLHLEDSANNKNMINNNIQAKNASDEDSIKKKILDSLKLLQKLFLEFQSIIKQINQLQIISCQTQSQVQNQSEIQLLKLSLIQIWNYHMQKRSFIQNQTTSNIIQINEFDSQILRKLNQLLQQNEQVQLKHEIQKYKYWQSTCIKIVVLLIREMNKLCNTQDQPDCFSKSSQFTESSQKKSLLTQMLKQQKIQNSKQNNQNNKELIISTEIKKKKYKGQILKESFCIQQKKKRFISENQLTFTKNSRINQIKPRKQLAKPCVQCTIF